MTLAPFRPARSLHREIDRLLNEWPAHNIEWHPTVDVREEEEAFVVTADLPGVTPEDVKINIESNVLTVSGERKQEKEEKDLRYFQSERAYGSFVRSFKLPSTIDSDHITATYKDGVLAISIPKVEKEKPKEISISTS